MSCLYDFFATLGPGWLNAATVLGAVFGLGLSVFAIWFSKKLSDDGTVLSEATRTNTTAIQQQTEAIHKHNKILRLDSLRNLYELSKGKDTHSYWELRWRFETYDRLSIQVQQKEATGTTILGHCDLHVQGFSNAADHVGFERRESDFYVARVENATPVIDQRFPFSNEDIVACFNQPPDNMISKGVDPWTTEPRFVFTISGLGHMQSFSGPRTVDRFRVFPRIKDL
jgi:hypothetical protein